TTSDAELMPGLEDLMRDAAFEVTGRAVRSPLGHLRFNAENGADALRQAFSQVEPIVHETHYEVPVAAPILAFVESLRAPVSARVGAGLDFDAFLAAVEQRLEARLRDKPIAMVRHTAFFIAYP
ncbi:MAG: hypothetical protein JWL83_3844, partial [Actinomycetia bacterium]|nr:hypothetical protein [Actinomycetes bacterium]